MQDSNFIHDYKKCIGKKIKQISVWEKRMLIMGAGMLVIGLSLGNTLGRSGERKRADQEIQQITREMRAEEQKKTEKLQEELERFTRKEQEGEGKTLPWNLELVNNLNPMKEGYIPRLEEIEDGYSVHHRIAEPLREMLGAAEKEGLHIIICSAYRSVEKQTQVFNSSVRERLDKGMNYWEAYKDTSLSVALPGKSEHGMGLSVDLISNQYTELDAKQAQTKEAKWLEKNCYKYGFILRYPPEKMSKTGIIYEPWHYRYVGKKDAEKIMKSGVTLEEYLHEEY